MQVKKQQLELDMEQQTVSKLGKEYVKVVYCHSVYLAYIQSESESHSVMSNSLLPHGLYSPWNFPGQNTGVGNLYYAKAFDCVDHNKLWKIFQAMGVPDHLTFLLRYLYAGQEATVRTGHATMDWFQTGKGEHQGCILSPYLLT